MQAKRTLIIAAATLAATLAAPAAALDHSGSQTGVWALADSPHVVLGDVFVPESQTLVIEAGCSVLMNPDTSFQVGGTLVANGTPGLPISLVSRELSPSAGDWSGLTVGPAGAAWMNSVLVRGAVTGVSVADGGSLDADGLTVLDSLQDGLVLAPDALGSLIGCTFDRNAGTGLVVEGGAPLVMNCTMRLNDVAMRSAANAFPVIIDSHASFNRSLDGILVDTGSPLTGLGAWLGGGLPWVVPAGDVLRVESGGHLSLDGGALVQFGTGAVLQVAGLLDASGNEDSPVLLTSLSDDEAAGDTNRDGGASTPNKGDWRGIDVESGGQVNFTRVELRHADDGLRVLSGGSATLFDAEIHSIADRGLALGVSVSAVVQDSFFHDGDTGIQVRDTNGVAIGLVPGNGAAGGNNSFHCNASFDVDNGSGFVLQAHRNYWGSAPPDAGRFFGAVDTGEYLVQAPDAMLARGRLVLGLEAGTDLRFDWSETSTCARYQLVGSERPDGVFGPLMAPTTEETHLEPGAAIAIGVPVRYFRLNDDFEGSLLQ